MNSFKWLKPSCCTEKRNNRIKKALDFDRGDSVANHKTIKIYKDKDVKMFFLNPGKDDGKPIKGKKRKKRDMTPKVYAKDYPFKNKEGSIEDIWNVMIKLQLNLDEKTIKRIYRLIYRLAFMVDFDLDYKSGLYLPSDEFFKEIKEIQNEIDKTNYRINFKSFIGFLDLLGWNEDYKYHLNNNVTKSPMTGRLNCLNCIISVAIELKKLKLNKRNGIDYSRLVKMCYQLSKGRGIYSLGKNEFITELELDK